MKNLKTIWNFINSKFFGYILIAVFITLFIGTCSKNSSLKEESAMKDQNISALTDTIRTEKLKNEIIQVSINGYIADAKELEKYDKDLAKQVNDQKGKIVTLNNIVFHLKQDTTELRKYIDSLLTKFKEPEQINDSTWNVDWVISYVYDIDNYDIFDGRTQIGLRGDTEAFKGITFYHNKTLMLNRDSKMSLTWGQKYEGNRLKVFAQTTHPAFKAQLLEGTYVKPYKTKKWFTGFGIGPSLNVGWDFLHNQPSTTIGLSIHYNIFSW